MIRPLLVAAAAWACGPGCGEPEATVVVVTVETRPAVTDLAQLSVTARNDSQSIQSTFETGTQEPPLTFSITPEGRTGLLSIEARALDAGGGLVGVGATEVTIVADARADASLLLDPADFVVNTSIAGDQRLAFLSERNGRQLSGNADGFTVVFINDCAQLGRCDVFGRHFDAEGRPAENGITTDSQEFIANLSDEVASVPSIGVGPTGTFIAWETGSDVRGVALDAGGAHIGGAETIVSDSTEFPGDSSVAAVPGGDYVVAWSELGGGAIRGRLVDENGAPRVNPVTNDTLDFPIASSPSGTPERPSLAITGSGHGFAAFWRNANDLRARFYDDNAAPLSGSEATLVSHPDGTDLVGPHGAFSDEGFVVVWGIDGGFGEQSSFFLQRFSTSGAPDGPTRVLGVVDEAFPSTPDVAALDSGMVGAVWERCDAEGDGAGCSILFQLFRPSGLPVGRPVVANTTTAGDQTDPAIAAVAGDRFAVVWTDESMQPPDEAGSSVRGRVIYPEVDPDDGRLGARCGGAGMAECQGGLTCVAGSEGVAYCHELCDPAGPDPQCPLGGVCTDFDGTGGCLF